MDDEGIRDELVKCVSLHADELSVVLQVLESVEELLFKLCKTYKTFRASDHEQSGELVNFHREGLSSSIEYSFHDLGKFEERNLVIFTSSSLIKEFSQATCVLDFRLDLKENVIQVESVSSSSHVVKFVFNSFELFFVKSGKSVKVKEIAVGLLG